MSSAPDGSTPLPSGSVHRELSRLAAQRHGVVTVADAMQAGLTPAQLRTARRSGDWSSPVRGLLVAVAAPATWEQECAIAVLATGGVLSHRAAARLHRLDGFDEAPCEVTLPRGRTRAAIDVVMHRTATLDPADITEVSGLPVTSIARTLVDLGAVVDDDSVEQALDDALRRGSSSRWITSTLERLDRPGPSGPGALRRVLARPDRRGPLPDSAFERLVQRNCAELGLPEATRQHEVHDAVGRLVGRLDLAWPELKIGVEAHSRRWHFGAAASRVDQHRANQLAALGWLMLYVGWSDLNDHDRFAVVLRDAHATRATWPHTRS